MVHYLSSRQLVEQLKAQQTTAVAALRAQGARRPHLAIVLTVAHPAIQAYTRMKRQYGADLGVDVTIHDIPQASAPTVIAELNNDPGVDAIIIQLPIAQPEQTQQLVNLVAPQKDVDGLGEHADFTPATPLAILWLLGGHHISLRHKNVVLVGHGRLVGKPLARLLRTQGVPVNVVDSKTSDFAKVVKQAEVLISATGQPGIITNDLVQPGCVVVDAGVAGEQGKTVGDVAPEVLQRTDIRITPPKGGVGPLTVCALFDNTIKAASVSHKEL